MLDCQPKVVRRWLGFDPSPSRVPAEVGAWFEHLGAAIDRHPPPQGWKRRA